MRRGRTGDLAVALAVAVSCHCSAGDEPLPPVRPAPILEVGSPTICLLPPALPPVERSRVGGAPSLQACLGTPGDVTLLLSVLVSRQGEVAGFSASTACWNDPYSFTPAEERCLQRQLALVRYVPDGDGCPLQVHFPWETFSLRVRGSPSPDPPDLASRRGRRTRVCS